MALWEYKVITSGVHGFASLSLLESHLNTLGKDEWEIIHFQTLPNNPLAFNGLVRRSTVRDWTPPAPVVVTQPRPSIYEPAPADSAGKPSAHAEPETEPASVHAREEKKEPADVRDASLRTFRNTDRDLDPDAEEEDDWDNWADKQDDLPTFFEAIKPHLRRNQKGAGMSVGIDHLARRWEQREADILSALKECGFTITENEEADPDYFEFEGDLYWVNRNSRGIYFINTREKPRPVFRTVPVTKLSPDDPAAAEIVAERNAEKAEIEKRKIERLEREAAVLAAVAARQSARDAARALAATAAEARAAQAAVAPAETSEQVATSAAPDAEQTGDKTPISGEAMLKRIGPMMRRNRRGPGYSGSVTFLARALKMSDAEFVAALAALNLNVPTDANDKPVYVEIGNAVYWVNKDGRGGIWINGRERKEGSPRSATDSTHTAATSVAAAVGTEPNTDGTVNAALATPTSLTVAGDELPANEVPASESVLSAEVAVLVTGTTTTISPSESATLSLPPSANAVVTDAPITESAVAEPLPVVTNEVTTLIAAPSPLTGLPEEPKAEESTAEAVNSKPKAAKTGAKKASAPRPRTRKPKADEADA